MSIEHTVIVGMQRWTSTSAGTVVETERRRHGLHHRRSADDRVWSDVIVIERDDGERTTLTVDEFTRIRRREQLEAGPRDRPPDSAGRSPVAGTPAGDRQG